MKTTKKMKISRTQFEIHMPIDECPDTSWLGEYSNKPGPYAIKRENATRGEYQYFNPCWENYAGENEETIRKYCQQDYERMESYNDGQFQFVGVRACVEIKIPNGKDFILHTVESPGIWGIESDSGKDFIEETYREECDVLQDMLETMGIEVTP